MSKWTSMAKTHFLQEGVEATPKTPETRLTGVMGVVPQHLSKLKFFPQNPKFSQ